MTLWFVRGLRRGVVTTRYPARPDESATHLPTPPAFRADQLTRQAADELVALCPSRALRRDAAVLVFDVGACTACGRCEAAAGPAIMASHEFELAATDRCVLIKRIPLRGEER
jgi:ferredoxin-like protein FixX